MTDSTYPATGGFVDNTSAATFIPEIWSDEVVAAYQKNLVLANLVKKISMTGKKGDTLHIPKPVRGDAHAKAENTAVTVQNATESEVQVTINKHFEYSRLIEDITETQALASLRQFYTGDAGYALAKQVDSSLFELGKSFGDNGGDYVGTGSYYIDASSGLTAYAADTVASADVFTDAGFRDLIQKMDDADVPMDNRCLVVPPSVRNEIMGLTRYSSSDFVDGRVVNNGQIGNIYGIDIFVSSNCPVVEAAADNSAGGDVKQAMLFHKDAMVLAEQMGVRSQTQYKQDFLATLYTADTLYGTAVLRSDAAFNLMVNG
jgi:N4-gp56 family major capsid protein|tara:strand:- start:670 stop:1620 length:951 start_codon:yes stop_codon:yes gene_type:complete